MMLEINELKVNGGRLGLLMKRFVWDKFGALTSARDWKRRVASPRRLLSFAAASSVSPRTTKDCWCPFVEQPPVASAAASWSGLATARRACTFCSNWNRFKPEDHRIMPLMPYRCRGCGLNLACPYMRTFCCWRAASLSIGGGKKLVLEPWRCSGGGVGSQSWLCDADGSKSMSCSRPGES